jgi:hypothetical protein
MPAEQARDEFPQSAPLRRCVSLESRIVTKIIGKMGQCVTESLLLVVDLSPLVMAIWPQWAHMGHPGRFRMELPVLQGAMESKKAHDAQYWSRRRGRTNVCTHTRG